MLLLFRYKESVRNGFGSSDIIGIFISSLSLETEFSIKLVFSWWDTARFSISETLIVRFFKSLWFSGEAEFFSNKFLSPDMAFFTFLLPSGVYFNPSRLLGMMVGYLFLVYFFFNESCLFHFLSDTENSDDYLDIIYPICSVAFFMTADLNLSIILLCLSLDISIILEALEKP